MSKAKRIAKRILSFVLSSVIFTLFIIDNGMISKAAADIPLGTSATIELGLTGPGDASEFYFERSINESFPTITLSPSSEYLGATGTITDVEMSGSGHCTKTVVDGDYIITFDNPMPPGWGNVILTVRTYDSATSHSDFYNISIEYNVKLLKPNLTASLSNYQYLELEKPEISSDKSSIYYALDSDDPYNKSNQHWYNPSTGIPELQMLEPGTHTLVFVTDEDETYEEASKEITFVVLKGDPDVELMEAVVLPGTEPNYVVNVRLSSGTYIYTEGLEQSIDYTVKYRSVVGLEGVYTTTVPTEPGKYEALLVMGDDYKDKYNDAKVIFEMVSTKGTGTVTAKDINYAEKLNITVESKDYDAKKAVLYYKLQSEDDSKYTKNEPEDPGKYIVKAVFPANDKFEAAEATDTFEIKVVEGKAKITVADIKYGETPKPVIESDDYDKEKAKIYYKESGASDDTFSATIPKKPGSYIAQVIFPANKIFSQHIETCKFQINKADGEGEITAKDMYVGMKPVVTATSNKNGIDKVKYEYKLLSESENAYSSSIPTKPGTYQVRATFPETDLYLAAKSEATFKVSYLPNPGYSTAGVKGKNGYYTSDVTIMAPAGYQISTTFGSGYVDSLKYSAISQSNYIYFKEIATGALSDKVELSKYKIDNVKPEFSDDIKNNDILFLDEKVIDINDDNLESVTVNGKSVAVSNGRASISLASNGGIETYVVIAVDKAGNEISYTITVKSEWMEKGIIPEGEIIKLYAGTGYELEEGEWKVSGDNTVYNGGMKVYVASDMEMSFSR